MKAKHILLITLLFFSSCIWRGLGGFVNAQNIGINTSGASPDASAMLDIVATDKGLLLPRVALTITTSASPVTSPATGLLVYNSATINDVTPGFYYWDGTKWVRFTTGTSTSTSGFTHFQVFDANATFTVPAGITQVMIEAWGAGGGGGYSDNSNPKPGGGGGGYGKIVANVAPGDVLTVTVGTAGTGGAFAPSDGTSGGTSKVVNPASQTLITANGGGGSAAGGTGGTATSFGTTSVVPYSMTYIGGDSYYSNLSGGSAAGANAAGGGGQGASRFGTSAGKAPGGGGKAGNSGATDGGKGRVIIWW